MIACPWCHYAHPSQSTAKQCAQCHQSFETLYLCTDQHCTMHKVFQQASRECHACQRTLTGEFSGRNINWGNATYRIREYLGGGGMGEVYRGVEEAQAGGFSRECAVKFNKNMMDSDVVERFKLEVQVLNLLQNPHNIRVYNYGELYEERHTGLEVRAQFMVMELLKGETLNEIIQNGGLAPQDALPIFIEICGALSEAHQKDIIHRDIKPHNIMIQNVSGSQFAKVFDFGLARQTNSMDARLSTSGVVMGTFRYMSPEQALGEDVDNRTDIFSLGVVLYEVLSTRHPFPGKNLFELFTLHQNGPPPLPEVPPGLSDIIMRSLAYEKDSRYNTADDLRNDLQFWLGDSFSGRHNVSGISHASGGVITRPPLTGQRPAIDNSHAHAVPDIGARDLIDSPQANHDSLGTQRASEKSKAGLFIGLTVGLILLVGFGGYMLLQGDKKKTPKNPDTRIAMAHTRQAGTKGTPARNTSPQRPQPAAKRTQPAPINFGMRRAAPAPQRRTRRVRRRRRRRRRYRRRRYTRRPAKARTDVRVIPPPRRVVEPPPRRVVVVQPRIPTPPRPRVRVVVVAPRPRIVRRAAPPPRPRCPSQSGSISYAQLDRSLGRSLTTRRARLLNRAAGSAVYDSGLRLSQSWKRANVLCKKSYLCSKVKRLLAAYCRSYKPHGYCSGYSPALSGRRFVCRK